MLVLSRKEKEQILIGEDITITLLRIDGNKVRIGIDAPKEVRIIRGELRVKEASLELDVDADAGNPISDREQAFAHPQESQQDRIETPRVPALAAGKTRRPGLRPQVAHAPLADYMTAG